MLKIKAFQNRFESHPNSSLLHQIATPGVPQELGRLKAALTTWGYVGGKINFIICTYLMCIAP